MTAHYGLNTLPILTPGILTPTVRRPHGGAVIVPTVWTHA